MRFASKSCSCVDEWSIPAVSMIICMPCTRTTPRGSTATVMPLRPSPAPAVIARQPSAGDSCT
jgi:hypothetical protein